MIKLQPIAISELSQFQRMVEAYWRDVMPSAEVIQSAEKRDAYFQRAFSWDADAQPPVWAIVEGQVVGFIHYTAVNNRATIQDFYVDPQQRRKGYGTLMLQVLYTQFDTVGIKLVELNVRRDTPKARAFWEAQGFRVASYRMRQYRDPQTGQSFIGALSSDFVNDGKS